MHFKTPMTEPWDKKYSADAEYGSVRVRGRGNGYSSAKNFLSAMKHIDKQLTDRTKLEDQRVTDFVQMLERNVPPVTPTQAFDIAEVVPKWCDTIYEARFEGRQNLFNADILRIIVHTMFMTELASARRSLFTKYSPGRDQVTLVRWTRSASRSTTSSSSTAGKVTPAGRRSKPSSSRATTSLHDTAQQRHGEVRGGVEPTSA